jgi:FkbM family methyltransferase
MIFTSDDILKKIGRINLLPFGIRYRIINYFAPLSKNKSKEFKQKFFTKYYYGKTDNYIDWIVFYFGCFESDNLYVFKKILNFLNCKTILDIGSNVGHHTLFFSIFSNRVFSFEPNQSLLNVSQTLLMNNNITNVSLLNFGLSDEDNELSYFEPSANQLNKGTGSFYQNYNEGLRYRGRILVRNGDSVINELQINRIDFIKIDVEGMEFLVINGLVKTLVRDRPIVVLELSKKNIIQINSENDLLSFFPNNYRIFFIKGRSIKKYIFGENFGDIVLIPDERNNVLNLF